MPGTRAIGGGLRKAIGADPVRDELVEAHTTSGRLGQGTEAWDLIFGRLIRIRRGFERTEGVPVRKIPLEPITNLHGNLRRKAVPREAIWFLHPGLGSLKESRPTFSAVLQRPTSFKPWILPAEDTI